MIQINLIYKLQAVTQFLNVENVLTNIFAVRVIISFVLIIYYANKRLPVAKLMGYLSFV